MEKVRIQKIIADSGMCSRRKAEEYINTGRVLQNGRRVKIGDKADPENDLIAVDGINIQRKKSQNVYYMLHKPRGYVTTMQDEKNRKCIADLIVNIKERVYPIGRLDVNSEGLILLTNDGDFANKLMHPVHHVNKVYRVTIRPDITDEQCAILSAGIIIDGKMTAPSVVNVISKEKDRVVLEIILREGRNRQIRKMLESLNIEVARLKRTNIGPVKLGMLKPGDCRELRKEEIRALKNAVKKEK